VIDGANRDTQLSLDLGYPVFSRSYSMRTGKDRVQVAAEQIPITIGGAEIAPGDLLRGDADGVVAIPKQAEQRVIETAERIQAAEAQIRERLEAGLSLRAAREELRYHSLQRPQS
jgi:regulator of RNase E activity RraA